MDDFRDSLTEDDKKFIIENYQKMSPLQIAVRLNLSTENRKCPLITSFIENANLKPKDSPSVDIVVKQPEKNLEDIAKNIVGDEPTIPVEIEDSPLKVISIEEFATVLRGLNIDIRTPLTERDKKDISFILKQMEARRYLCMYRSYRKREYKDLFKEEFIRALWGKGEMPQEEINDFLDVCNETVNQYDIKCKIRELEKMREDSKSDTTKIALVNLISELRDKELNSSKRSSEIKKTLGANREQRLKDSRPTGLTIMSLIEAFQDYEKRQSLLRLQERKDQKIEETVKVIDDFEEAKAMIIGIGLEELREGGL